MIGIEMNFGENEAQSFHYQNYLLTDNLIYCSKISLLLQIGLCSVQMNPESNPMNIKVLAFI